MIFFVPLCECFLGADGRKRISEGKQEDDGGIQKQNSACFFSPIVRLGSDLDGFSFFVVLSFFVFRGEGGTIGFYYGFNEDFSCSKPLILSFSSSSSS